MDRDEFLRTLREALSGEVAPNIIEENIRYYDAYISDEVRKGRSEQEVIEELGGARVIARTIIDVAAAGGDAGTGDPYGDAYRESSYEENGRSHDSSQSSYREENPYETDSHHRSFHVYDLNKWYWRLLFWVVLAFIIFILFSLVMGIASLLWPFLVIGLIIWMIQGLRR